MARVSTYLNFMGQSEEAMNWYQSIFGGSFVTPFMRYNETPPNPDAPALSEAEGNQIMHVELEILSGHVIMATDMLESMGHAVRIGNNTTINLEPDSKEETERLYRELSDDATDASELQQMFWGSLWGTCLDRFGVRWMFNFGEPTASPA